MTHRTSPRSALSLVAPTALLAAGLYLVALHPAAAQMGMPGGPLNSVGPMGALNSPSQGRGGIGQQPKPVPQPEALPGAKATTAVAPATKLPTDMSPNDALFDAINRGDIAAARDALNRGADLDAKNILGMTPMELSVDLGRNNISFLLLSMRSDERQGGSGSAARPGPAVAAVQPQPGKRAAVKPAKVAQVAPAPQVPMAPRLFANDGGTPNPSAGFLGFGQPGSR
jgi:hypothetical protein